MKRIVLRVGGLVVALALGLFLAIRAEAALINGGFESGELADWSVGGQAGVISKDEDAHDVVHSGDYAAWIGTVDFGLDNINDYTGEDGVGGYIKNFISQSFSVDKPSILELWYNYYTWDKGTYDDPGFVIEINSSRVFTLSSYDVNGNRTPEGVPGSTGWRLFTYSLDPGDVILKIYAGNMPETDNLNQSWVYIDDVQVSAVPLPGALSFLAIGCLGLLGLRRGK